jgi:hypothetical protein
VQRTILVLGVLIMACADVPDLTPHAERYMTLVLAVGEHDPDYVDAYYGPGDLRDSVRAAGATLPAIGARALALSQALDAAPRPADPVEALRLAWLRGQVRALAARVAQLDGQALSFDEEARLLYDADPPRRDEAAFQALLTRLDSALPSGPGSVSQRVERYRQRFVIPPARLDTVFRAAIAECRARTAAQVGLPEGESFTIEYVTDKPWSGYNWYQGNYTSLIQVNTDLPIFIDRAVDLACHEGYPGHHVYNALLEERLVRGRGWPEFQVYALFSPQSLVAEGTANYGITMAFPGAQRWRWESEHLFPLAGLPAAEAERYYAIQALIADLSYAGNEAARRYLDGAVDADEAVRWLETYALMAPARARQRLRFIERYRSYVINYNLGQDLVADAVAGDWTRFLGILTTPRIASTLP